MSELVLMVLLWSCGGGGVGMSEGCGGEKFT